MTISKATQSNWQRLHTSNEGRLAKRANKTQSSKKVIAANYAQSSKASELLNIANAIKAPTETIIYTLCMSKLLSKGIEQRQHVQTVLQPYLGIDILPLKIHPSIWDTEEDLLGFVYQSILPEGERNATGQYYTSQKIVKRMLGGLKLKEGETLYDPCCGSGAFLMGVETTNPENLYGTDINPLAVLIAKVNLLVKYHDKEFIPNIECADFLYRQNTTQTFDFIYTNPPWGADKENKYKIDGIKSKERASMFLVKAMEALKPNGHLHFLMPSSLLKIKTHKDIRSFIINHSTIQTIEIYKGKFDGVFTDYFSIRLLPVPTNHQDYYVKMDDDTAQVSYDVLKNQSDIPLTKVSPVEESIMQKVTAKANDYLTHSKWALGIVTGNNREKLLSDQVEGSELVYTGKEIEPFIIEEGKKYIVFDPSNFQQCAKEELFRTPEKLIYRFIANRPVVAYDNQQRLCLNSANILIPQIDTISVKSIAAFLNSSLYQYVYIRKFPDFKVLKGNLSTLPFPAIPSSLDQRLSYLVTLIVEKGSTTHIAQEIDDEIFRFFGINDEERNIILQNI